MSRRGEMLLYAALTAFLALLPVLVLLYLSYLSAVEAANGEIGTHARRAIASADRALTRVEGVLRELLPTVAGRCTAQVIDALTVAVYRHPEIREIAMFGADDVIRCTNFGLVEIDISPRLNEVANADGSVSITTGWTQLMRGVSVVTYVDAPEGWGLNAVSAPSELLADADPVLLDEHATVSLRLANGLELARRGTALAREPAVRAAVESRRYPVTAIMSVPERFITARWKEYAVLAGSAALVCSVVLTLAMVMFIRRRFSIEGEIRSALRGDEFYPVYQPLVDLDSGLVAGCEALVRWRRPDGNEMPPGVFMPVAERSGAVMELTRRVMKQACEDMRDVARRIPDFHVGINLVAEHFADTKIVDDVQQTFTEDTLPARNVALEITERQPLGDLDHAREVISRLQQLGVLVELDDAGTGHGGLAYLQKLGMDVIKIDKMFVDVIGTDSPAAPVADALIELAAQLGMRVIAEGVEEPHQLEYLRARGVRYVQGYVFSPPLPREEFLRFCARPVSTQKR